MACLPLRRRAVTRQARGPSRPYRADPGRGGELISSCAITPDGELRWEAIADRGADARDAIDQAASELRARLHDTVIDRRSGSR